MVPNQPIIHTAWASYEEGKLGGVSHAGLVIFTHAATCASYFSKLYRYILNVLHYTLPQSLVTAQSIILLSQLSFNWHRLHPQPSDIGGILVGNKILIRCSKACRYCSNYIFILDLTPGLNGLGKDNGRTRRQTFKFGNLCDLYKRFDAISNTQQTPVTVYFKIQSWFHTFG